MSIGRLNYFSMNISLYLFWFFKSQYYLPIFLFNLNFKYLLKPVFLIKIKFIKDLSKISFFNA